MSADSFEISSSAASLDETFPPVDPQTVPLGARVLVQLARTIKKSKGGIVLVEETKETLKWNNQVAKVIALGPLAFRNRKDAAAWPEGMWVDVGDYIRVPRWNGDRIEIAVKDGDPIIFVVFNDHEIISKLTGNPLEVRTYLL